MSFTIKEKWDGRDRGAAGTKRAYHIVHNNDGGPTDENAATQALFDWLDPVTGNLGYVNTPGLDANYEQISIGCKEKSGTYPIIFEGSAAWKWVSIAIAGGKVVKKDPKDTDDASFSYNAQAEGGKIVTSKKTELKESVRWHLNNSADPEYNGRFPDALKTDFLKFNGHINAQQKNKKWEYKGLDLSPPPTTFELTWAVPNAIHTDAFRHDMMKWVGTTNQNPFTIFGHEYAQGELFYAGVSGTKRTESDWEISWSFSYKRNRFDYSGDGGIDERVPIYGGAATVPMQGHDYLWLYDIRSWDPTKKQYTDPGKYSGIYVERLWDRAVWEDTSLNLLQPLVIY